MAKSSVKKTNIKQTIKKIAKKIMTKAISKNPKDKVKKAVPVKKVATKPAKTATAKPVAKAVEIKKSPTDKNKKPAILQKSPKVEVKAKSKETSAPKKAVAPLKVKATKPPAAPKVDTSTKAIFRKENLIFKEPHELMGAQDKNGAPVVVADEESKKDKKNKGIIFKVVTGQEAEKWKELQHKLKNQKPVTYSMRDVYEAQTPIQHKTLGWGVILNVQNDRLEVLFEDGIKFLISNYQP